MSFSQCYRLHLLESTRLNNEYQYCWKGPKWGVLYMNMGTLDSYSIIVANVDSKAVS